MRTNRFAYLAAILVLLGAPKVRAFDYARYQAADLDKLMEQRRPQTGVDIHPGLPLKITVTLTSYAEPCEAGILKKSMIVGGAPKDTVEATRITRCIKVRSSKNKVLSVFIQDQVAEFLPKEVPIGSTATLFAIHVFTGRDGPGLLVTEFSAGNAADAEKKALLSGCGCGSTEFHPGVDYSAPEGAPVPAADDGVVVKVEENEQASVDAPNAGRCGRYVVLKHSYPNGRSVFTRYAQLGRLVSPDGKPLLVGMRIMKNDKIGEVGSRKTLHFEVRPVEPATMDGSAAWLRRYGADTTMEWSRFHPADPAAFNFETFGGKGSQAK